MAAGYDREGDKSAVKNRESSKLFARLRSQGLFKKGMRVLDVGCGTGRMAIAFALQGAEVYALDFSSAMLERMRQNFPKQVAGKIHIVQADWVKLDLKKRGWQQAFDLVFACMTPAIRTPDAFLKLHAASCGGCYYRGWAGRRKDSLLQVLWPCLTGRPAPPLAGMAGSVHLAFNFLYAMGCSPSVEFQEVCFERRITVEQATRFFATYFKGLNGFTPRELRKKIKACLALSATDGFVIRRNEGRTGSIAWRKQA